MNSLELALVVSERSRVEPEEIRAMLRRAAAAAFFACYEGTALDEVANGAAIMKLAAIWRVLTEWSEEGLRGEEAERFFIEAATAVFSRTTGRAPSPEVISWPDWLDLQPVHGWPQAILRDLAEIAGYVDGLADKQLRSHFQAEEHR